MSCFIMNAEPMAALAGWIADILNYGYENYGFDAPEKLREAVEEKCPISKCGDISEADVFRELYNLNMEAYLGRYRRAPADVDLLTVPDYKTCRKHKRTSWVSENGGHALIEPWHYEMAKRLDCLIYQCTEDGADSENLYYGLIALRSTFLSYIVRNSNDYAASEWGR